MTTLTQDRPVKRVHVTTVFDRLQASRASTVVCVGGASSSKSYSMAQHIVRKLANERNKVFGVSRKTFPALRMTAQALVLGLLKEYGYYQRGEHNKAEHTFTLGTNLLQFFSLDDPEKIKSFTANYIWLEEATDFSLEDYLILGLRLSEPTVDEPNQMFLTLNPIDENHWIHEQLVVPAPPDVEVIQSTYRDNPFLSEVFRSRIEALEKQDVNYHRIYALGKWGRLEHLIYSNWDIIDEMPADCEINRYGVDFGFENPSVVVHLGFNGDDLYIDEVLHQNHMTNSDLIAFLKEQPLYDLYADSAEPQRIEEMVRAGIPAHKAIKNVTLGIDTVKRYRMHITKRSATTIREVRVYSRRTDRQGHVLEEPVKFNDHSPDAIRYGVMGAGEEPQEQLVVFDSMQLVGNIDL